MPPDEMLTARQAAAMARSIRNRLEVCKLDLTDRVVVTEAATGAYASTAAAAAAAGAEVYAYGADTPYGTVEDAEADVTLLFESLDPVAKAPAIVTERTDLPLERADLVTNSGVLRPIDASMIDRLPPTAVIALMYEAWEARDGDLDYAAASRRGIPIIAVDEHHAACGAFDFVGDLALAAALRRGWPIRGIRFSVLSDNAFGAPIQRSLRSLGAAAEIATDASEDVVADIVIVAVTPATSGQGGPATIKPAQITELVIDSGAFAAIQLWGDLDTDTLKDAGVLIEPEVEPKPGHQGIAMSEAGFEAVVRLQVAGIAAAIHVGDEDGPLRGLGQRLVWESG